VLTTHDLRRGGRGPRPGHRVRDGRLAATTTACTGLREWYRAALAGGGVVSEHRSVANFLRVAGLVARKDLTIEMRSREILYTTLFFAVSCVLVFSFGFVKEGAARRRRGGDPVDRDRLLRHAGARPDVRARADQRDAARADARASDRPAVYLGKLLGIVALLGAVEVIVAPLVALLFQAPLLAHPVWLVALLVTGTVGFAAVGTLFAAMLVRARSRTCCCPSCCIRSRSRSSLPVSADSGAAAAGRGRPMARAWVSMLVFFDVVFVTLSLWTFDAVMTE